MPGASIGYLHVMAYTTDGCDLITIKNEEAKSKSLTVIEDPRLKETMEAKGKRLFGIPAMGPWGPYRCPSCAQLSLQLWHSGFWD